MNPRAIYRDCVEAIGPLLEHPSVAERWDDESALAEMSVGHLAGHLLRVMVPVEAALAKTPPLGPSGITAAEYYATVVESNDLGAPANVGVRERARAQAEGGPEAVVAEYKRVRESVLEGIRDQPSSRLVSVINDLVLTLDEYLVTRVVEAVVHVDDLAVSVGIDTPELPAEAHELTIRTLTDIARHRHGDLAVVRALARRERDAVQALRVL